MTFKPVTLRYQGAEKTIDRSKILSLVAQIEADVVTIPELMRAFQSGNISFARLARVYGIIMREAGFTISDEEAYETLFTGEVTADGSEVTQTIMTVLLPPKVMQGNSQALSSQKAGPRASSSKPSKRR